MPSAECRVRCDRRAALEGVAEGDGEGVGGVGRRRGLVQVEERLDHEGDLVFAAAAVGGDELLDLDGL